MGCVGSKPEESPAVTLCRQRCSFLDHAIHQRYVLSEAHLAYFVSLKNVGVSLHRFFDVHSHAPVEPPSPVLNLPETRKGHAPHHHHVHDHDDNHSDSGDSHLHFHDDDDSDEDDDDEDEDDDSDVELHSVHHKHSPVHGHGHGHGHGGNHGHRNELPHGNFNFTDQGQGSNNYSMPYYAPPPAGYQAYPNSYQPVDNNNSYPLDYPPPAGYPPSNYTMNYMRKQPTPSVVYQQRPMNPETIHYGEASSSSSYYNNNNNNASSSNRNNEYSAYQNPNYYANNNNGGFGGYGDFFGESSSRQVAPPAYGGGMEKAASAAPPPPPPPPPSSGWDFLNPFETYDSYYPTYTPSRDSREVREEEGIPDLEEEDLYQEEVVKEIHSTKPKFVNDNGASGSGGGGGGGASSSNVDAKKAPVVDDDSEMSSVGDLHYRSGPSVVPEEEPVEFEVHVVEKGETSRGGKPVHQFHDDSEVVKEIQVQFDRASESGNELAKMLEVGKVPHNRKHAAYQVSSKMLNAFSPSLAVAISKHSDDAEVDSRIRSHNLSSTLHKLYLWEKKLLEEVKVEEKMRLEHDEKDRRLKRLDEKGAEQQKIDATRILVRSLSTRIRIAIQVVDKISAQIDRLRDEELWPQLNEFIQGLTRMWRSMRDCHQNQCQAIAAAKQLDAIASNKHASDECLEATLQLEHELLNWTLRFSCWFGAQKGFVTSLNNWLLKCLLHIPEETDDGPVPFSPSRIGAPTIFIICNQWAQAIDRISDKEVVNSMRDFVRVVLQLWDRDKQEMRRRFAMHKNMESKVKSLDREDQKIQKELQVLNKQIVLSTGEHNGLSAVYQSETSKGVSAQTNLRLVFEAMEKFTAASLKVCEDLLQRIDEDRILRQQEGAS